MHALRVPPLLLFSSLIRLLFDVSATSLSTLFLALHSRASRAARTRARALPYLGVTNTSSSLPHSTTLKSAMISLAVWQVSAGRGFTPGQWRPNKTCTVRNWRCLFHECPATLREEKNLVTGCVVVMDNDVVGQKHNEHIEQNVESISVPGEIRELLSPTKLGMGPKELRGYLRPRTLGNGVKIGYLLDARDQRAERLRGGLERLHKAFLEEGRKELMTEGRSNTFGGLSSILEKFEKEVLVAKGAFNEHSTYLLGPPLVVPETKRVTCAFSTENLLLNAYRQTCFGVPPFIAIDTTHRLMRPSNYCFSESSPTPSLSLSCPFSLLSSHLGTLSFTVVIGTMSITQQFHLIAYAVCSHEDAGAHEYVIRQVFQAVDAVVADRARRQIRI
jgi:hypothetical protein